MADETWSFRDEFWFPVTFIYNVTTIEPVYLVGDFNGWTDNDKEYKMESQEEAGPLTLTIQLREGYYHYKFSVNGGFIRDYNNPHVGGLHNNSIMFVNTDPKVYGLHNQEPPIREHTPMGGAQFITLNPIPPSHLLALGVLQRLIFIYLPPSYHSTDTIHYPVIYAGDGQNLFSTPAGNHGPPWGGWYLDAKLDQCWLQKTLPEFILVAIPNSDYICIGNRQFEYTCTNINELTREPYVRYLLEFIKPLIDSKYRSLEGESHVLGASLGGLMAFLLALSPLSSRLFKSCICMSPAFWFIDREGNNCFSFVKSLNNNGRHNVTTVYIDSGDGDGDNKELIQEMNELLIDKQTMIRYKYIYDECKDTVPCGVTHSEWAWRERIIDALKFVLCNN